MRLRPRRLVLVRAVVGNELRKAVAAHRAVRALVRVHRRNGTRADAGRARDRGCEVRESHAVQAVCATRRRQRRIDARRLRGGQHRTVVKARYAGRLDGVGRWRCLRRTGRRPTAGVGVADGDLREATSAGSGEPDARRRRHVAVGDGEAVIGRAVGAHGGEVHRAAPCVRRGAVPGDEARRENALRQRTVLGQGAEVAPARVSTRRVARDGGDGVRFTGHRSAFGGTLVATPRNGRESDAGGGKGQHLDHREPRRGCDGRLQRLAHRKGKRCGGKAGGGETVRAHVDTGITVVLTPLIGIPWSSMACASLAWIRGVLPGMLCYRISHAVAKNASLQSMTPRIGQPGMFETPVAAAEIFNPATNTFSAGPSMVAARYGAAAATLSDGRVLIAGGSTGPFQGNHAIPTVEVFGSDHIFEGTFE